jgi:hypothetical protein
MLHLKSQDLRDVFRFCPVNSCPQPILAIADQAIPCVEQADPFRQASPPKDRRLADRIYEGVVSEVEVAFEFDVEASQLPVPPGKKNAQVPVDQF